MIQTLQRFIFPEFYWKKKRAFFQNEVQEKQAAFKTRSRAYHVHLQKRREDVMRAMSQAQKAGTDPDAARRATLQAFRDHINPLREEARQLGKTLRRAMTLQRQAESAARQQGQ